MNAELHERTRPGVLQSGSGHGQCRAELSHPPRRLREQEITQSLHFLAGSGFRGRLAPADHLCDPGRRRRNGKPAEAELLIGESDFRYAERFQRRATPGGRFRAFDVAPDSAFDARGCDRAPG